MTTKPGSIGIIPSFSILILAVGLMNHVIVIPPLLHAAKRDAWISVLMVAVPYLIWTTMIYLVMKRTNQQPLLTWLAKRYGRLLAWGVRIIFTAYLFLIGLLTLKETTNWTHVSYLPRTPRLVLAISLILVCVMAVQSGLKAIAISSGLLLPFVIVFGDFVMSANLPVKNYTLLTPMFENGMQPVISGGLYIGGGLVELIVILLMQHELKAKVKLWPLLGLALFLVLLVFGPVTGAIAEFGPFEAASLRYPAYEEWRLVTIGKYIRHVDFLSIYQWLTGAYARLAISLYLIVELYSNVSGRARSVWLWSLAVAMVVLATLPFSDMQVLAFLRDIYLPGSFYAMTGLLLLLFLLALLPKPKKEDGNHGRNTATESH